MSLYRFLATRIVQLESYDKRGINFNTVFKPQYRVVRWFNFKERDDAGQKQALEFKSVEGARGLIAFKTGAVPSGKIVVTIVE